MAGEKRASNLNEPVFFVNCVIVPVKMRKDNKILKNRAALFFSCCARHFALGLLGGQGG